MKNLTLILLLIAGIAVDTTAQIREENPAPTQTNDGTRSASGLYFREMRSGNGARPKLTDIVTIKFYQNEPVDTVVSMMFLGLQEGLQMMSVGSKYRFKIPPELAFGNTQHGSIYPNSTIICEVELLNIKGQNTVLKSEKVNAYETPTITREGVDQMHKAMQNKENREQLDEVTKAQDEMSESIPGFTKGLELQSEFDNAMAETVKFQTDILKAGTPQAEQKTDKISLPSPSRGIFKFAKCKKSEHQI